MAACLLRAYEDRTASVRGCEEEWLTPTMVTFHWNVTGKHTTLEKLEFFHSFISKIFPYNGNGQNYGIGFPTFFCNISKIFPYYRIGPSFYPYIFCKYIVTTTQHRWTESIIVGKEYLKLATIKYWIIQQLHPCVETNPSTTFSARTIKNTCLPGWQTLQVLKYRVDQSCNEFVHFGYKFLVTAI